MQVTTPATNNIHRCGEMVDALNTISERKRDCTHAGSNPATGTNYSLNNKRNGAIIKTYTLSVR